MEEALAQGRNRRLRAKEACVKCRSRKVRCDVYLLGAPCTNCSHSDLPCLLHAKRNKHGGIVHATKVYPRDGVVGEQPKIAPREDVMPASKVICSSDLTEHLEFAVTESNQDCQVLGSPIVGQSDDNPTLPGYVLWNDDRLSTQWHESSAIGAVFLPDPKVMNHLLENYIDWVHPQLPLLELSKFLSAISYGDRSPQLSLLLLQAKLHAGSLYADDKAVCQLAGRSVKEIRKTLRNRARILYDAGYDKDQLVLVQAAALLSMDRCGEVEDDDATQFWRNTTLTTFQEWIRLQTDREADDALLIRLWWSLHAVTNATTVREAPNTVFTAKSCLVELPSLSKFETRISSKVTTTTLQTSTFLKQPYLQRLLAENFIHRARLHKMVLEIIDETSNRDRQDGEFAKGLSRWDAELDKWWCGLPDYASDLKSAFEAGNAASIRLLSFHFAITATDFFSISDAVNDILMNMENPSSLRIIAIKEKRNMNAAKYLDIVSRLDERDLPPYLRNHGFTMVECALQRCLSSSNFSSMSFEGSGLLLLVKKFFDTRAMTTQRPMSLSHLIGKGSHLKGLAVAPEVHPKCHEKDDTLVNTDEGNTIEHAMDGLSSLSATSTPDGLAISYGDASESPDDFFSGVGVYTLDDDFMTPYTVIDG